MRRLHIALAGAAALALVTAVNASAWQIRKAAVAAYVGPGDVVPGARHFWSVRAYSAAKIGTVIATVRRASDSATQALIATATGLIDVATMDSFCAATTCTWVSFVDQITGTDCTTNCDLAGPAVARELTVVSPCTGLGAKPCARMLNATAQCALSPTNVVPQSLPVTVSSIFGNVAVIAPDPVYGFYVGNHSANPEQYLVDAAGIEYFCLKDGATSVICLPTATSTWYSWLGLFNEASSLARLNGAETAGSLQTGAVPASGVWGVGGRTTACDATMTGDWVESIVYFSGKDAAERAAIETNQRDFFGH